MEPQHTAVQPPVHLAIADDIRLKIERGELLPGTEIPTIHELARAWSASVASARAALALLREQGLISGGRGRPLQVRQPPQRVMRSSARHQMEKDAVHLDEAERDRIGTTELELGLSLKDVLPDYRYQTVPADELLAERFGITKGSEVLQRTYATTDKRTGHRLAWSVSHIPVALIAANPRLLDRSEEPWKGGTMHQLSTVGIEIALITDEVTARMPTTAERQLWNLDHGVPLLEVLRVSTDTTGRVVELSDAVYSADRTRLDFPTRLDPW